MVQEALQDLNEKLEEVSKRLYGEQLSLRAVNPSDLALLKKNARYMPKPMFDQLASNIGRDKALQSVPLCHTLKDGRLEVLSGNHRVKAAIHAGVKEIIVMVVPSEMATSKKRAVQLSHNSLSGQDDMQLLSELWKEISDIDERIYSGLDSVLTGEIGKINFSGFGPEQIRTEQISMWFVPDEIKHLDQLLEAMTNLAASRKVYLAPLSKYDELFSKLVAAKKHKNIVNTAVAFMAMIDELIAYEEEKTS